MSKLSRFRNKKKKKWPIDVIGNRNSFRNYFFSVRV